MPPDEPPPPHPMVERIRQANMPANRERKIQELLSEIVWFEMEKDNFALFKKIFLEQQCAENEPAENERGEG